MINDVKKTAEQKMAKSVEALKHVLQKIRTGRAHTGLIRRESSNERWCSDVLEIACWSGEIVQIGFALDCHDREALAHVGEQFVEQIVRQVKQDAERPYEIEPSIAELRKMPPKK